MCSSIQGLFHFFCCALSTRTTIFCSSTRKALTILSLKALEHKTPPYVLKKTNKSVQRYRTIKCSVNCYLDTVLRRLLLDISSLGLPGLIPNSFRFVSAHFGIVPIYKSKENVSLNVLRYKVIPTGHSRPVIKQLTIKLNKEEGTPTFWFLHGKATELNPLRINLTTVGENIINVTLTFFIRRYTNLPPGVFEIRRLFEVVLYGFRLR